MERILQAAWGMVLLLLSSVPALAQPDFSGAIGIGDVGREQASKLALDGRGGKYVLGRYDDPLPIGGVTLPLPTGPYRFGYNSFLIHYDAAGNVLWSKYLYGMYGGLLPEVSMQVDGNGDLVLGGTRDSEMLLQGMSAPTARSPVRNVWLAKYAYNGNLAWVHDFPSNDMEWAAQLTMDAAGNSYFAYYLGYMRGQAVPPASEIRLVKLSPTGTVLATRTDGVNQFPGQSTFPRSFVCDKATGNLYLSGWMRTAQTVADSSLTTTTGRDSYLVSYTDNFTPRWARTMVSTAPPNTPAQTIVASIEQLRVNQQGELLFVAYYGGTIQLGSRTFTNPAGQPQSWLVGAYSPAGQLLWAQPLQLGSYDTYISDLQPTTAGDILLCGSSNASFGFGPYTFSPVVNNDLGSPNPEGFVAALDGQGTPLWLRQTYGLVPNQIHNCQPRSLAIDGQGVINVAGSISGPTMFNAAILQPAGPTGFYDGFVAELGTVATRPNFAPLAGPGGSTVVISGSGLRGATSVRINGAAASFRVNANGDQIVATVPAGASTGPIAISTPGGTITPAGVFTVNAPLSSRSAVPAPALLFPNPARDAVQLRLPGAATDPVQVAVFDALDRRHLHTHLPAEGGRLDVRALPPGVYLVRLTSAQTTLTQRLVIE